VGVIPFPQPEVAPALDGVGQEERVVPMQLDVVMTQRREALDILAAHIHAPRAQIAQNVDLVERIPGDDEVDHQAQGPELFLLALPLRCP
jgi:hypothetical protein